MFLSFIWLNLALFFFACGETPSSQSHKPMTLKMDVPKPKRLTQSPIKVKTVPKIKKSKMNFNLHPNVTHSKTTPKSIHDLQSCMKEVLQFETIKNRIQTHGGIWGALEQNVNLKSFSSIGMQIDSKINKITHSCRHLCTTAKGLAYSPLAKFILGNLEEKTEKEFRNDLISKGVPNEDIDIYIDYQKSAKKSKGRNIPYATIQPSLMKTRSFIEYYLTFYNRIHLGETPSEKSLMPDLMAFLDALEAFLSEDTNIKIAIKEDFEKPFWMFDGDM